MPHLSKRKLDARTERLLIASLVQLISNLSPSQTEKLLKAIFTNTERLMLAKRVGASLLISEGISQAKISESLKLSEDTVHKFVLIIKAGDKSSWDFILHKLENWHELATLKESMKAAGMHVLKKFSRGMAGKI